MTQIEVFDPALCCSTGVCGPKVDPVLPRFAADLEWLKSRGVQVTRHNLAQQPAAFATHPIVQAELKHDAEGKLPLVLVNGEVRIRGIYPSRAQLAQWAGLAVDSLVEPAKRAGCGPSGCC